MPPGRVLQNSRQGVQAAFELLVCWRLGGASAVQRRVQTGRQRCKNRLRWVRNRVSARALGVVRTKLPNDDWSGRARGAAAVDDWCDRWLVARRRTPCPYDNVRMTVGAWGRTPGTRRQWRTDHVRRSFPCPPCGPNCPMAMGRGGHGVRRRRTIGAMGGGLPAAAPHAPTMMRAWR